MATWGEILVELNQSASTRGGLPDFDAVRRKYLANLYSYTKRQTIIYYADWIAGSGTDISITLEDVQAMMEVCKGLADDKLDVVLHTPGGSAEATASVVHYLRQKFNDIRVIVPVAAMSAGTMWSLAANRIVMGRHSQLGPIDPQILQGGRYVAARAIIEQFERAKGEIAADPVVLNAWYPILQQYGTALLQECDDAEAMSKDLVTEWLRTYMLADRTEPLKDAQQVASYFADHKVHRSHAMGIYREQCKEVKDIPLKVDDLEADQELQDAVLSVHHATMHTFAGAAVKIVENHEGRAYVKIHQQIATPQIMIGSA